MKQGTQLPNRQRPAIVAWFALAVLLFLVSPAKAQEPTAKEAKNIGQVKSLITKAGVYFKDKKFKSSAKLISNVQKKLNRFAKDADGKYRELLEAQYERFVKAHELLTENGQKLNELEPLPLSDSMQKAASEEAGSVSFVSTVAPIIHAKCGRCHVDRSRGQFSAKDYTSLMDSTTVTEGEPDVSRLIEVIVDGSMPKGGLSVSEEELTTLKKWIAEGAKFDGDDPAKNLSEFRRAGQANPGRPNRNRATPTMQKPTGNETVSFGTHVAPVLLEHCGRCHMARNPRGNFNMAQFRTFIRGGDSGTPVALGDSGNSNFIKRLRGIGGDVMPPRGKLDDDIINNIAKWIDEGAKFDPADANLTMQALAAKSKSQSLDHDQLALFRRKEADRIWKLVMSDVEPDRTTSDDFLLVGTPTEEGLDAIAQEAESLAKSIAKKLGTSDREHFIRGNGTLFVVTRRYDFGEFGKMLLRREFPRNLKSYWNHNQTIAYSALLRSRDQTVEDIRVDLSRQLASLHVADLAPGIPRWFADGMGFRVAAEMYRKDPIVLEWEADAVAAAQSMRRVDDFLMNRMDEDKSGLVSFLFVGQLKSNRTQFKKLMTGLKNGQEFDAVFAETYGATAEELFSRYQKR